MKMKKKSKISHIKKSNQRQTKLSKQGKLKKKRNKKKLLISKPIQQPEHGEYEEEDAIPTVGAKDLNFLRKAVKDRRYQILRNLSLPDPLVKNKHKRKKDTSHDDVLERNYEETIDQPAAKKQKILLPIKTSQGLVTRSEDVEESEDELEEQTTSNDTSAKNNEKKATFQQFAGQGEFTAAQLLAKRQATLQKMKFRIGLLSSGLLETPESKIGNFKPLLEMLDESDPQMRITVRKIALVSLTEVFKDLLPAYQIKQNDEPKVKLKKDVKQLHEYENTLLKSYKCFLQKVEKIISILKRKRGDMRVFKDAELRTAELAVASLCDILKTHPYFNFSKNIVNLLVPYLNCGKEGARNSIASCLRNIFASDSRGEISLEIVRCINKFVKAKNNSVHSSALEVLLALKLKDVNLDAEKEAEMKRKKTMSKKHNILRLSKRERKREKRLKELNQELLETKADENKQSTTHNLTEITKLVFAMYFRVLKGSPSSKLMKAALEGIAKFAHCINVDFYHDLINVLDSLIDNQALGFKEQLCCVKTVFTILNYQGATINIDPVRFYTHFYAQLLQVSGRTCSELPMILNAAEGIVIKRRKQLTMQRLLAFTKRLATLSLQVLPNGTLALLCLIRQVLQLSKATTVLLDSDATFGQGIYQPELEEPEYCNAGATALWELLALQRHYHPTVRAYAKSVSSLSDSSKESVSGKAFINSTYEQLSEEYDPSEMKFVPAVPPPSSIQRKKRKPHLKIVNIYLKDHIKDTLSTLKTF